MVERRTVYSSDELFEPDPIYDDEFKEVLFELEGDEFRRKQQYSTLGGEIWELWQDRHVVLVTSRDQDGNIFYEPYNPAIHGEEMDLTVVPMDRVINSPDFFGPEERELTNARKRGASRTAFNVEDFFWRARGGNPSSKIPK